MKRLVAVISVVLAVVALGGAVFAAEYPEKPITYQVPFGPGGQLDIGARRQQPLLEKELGVTIKLLYKPGEGGAVGWANLLRQPADGYFISGINIPHIVLQPLARRKPGYETHLLEPIALFQSTPVGIAVLNNSPFASLADLVTHARNNPGKVVCGGSGTWTGHHVAFLQFQKLADIKMRYTSFTGSAASVAAFLDGHVDALFISSSDLIQHTGRIRALAMGTAEPFPHLPDVPTFRSQGFDLLASIDRGVAVPAGTPPQVIAVLEAAFLKIVRDPDIQKQLIDEGFVPLAMGSVEAKAYIQSKVKQWKPVVKSLMP